MILGIGIDSVDIGRFTQWHTFSRKQLERIFSAQEIDYCLAVPIKRAQRFAVRFAAREAFFKALGQSNNQNISFLTVCKYVKVINSSRGVPDLQVNWKMFSCLSHQSIQVFISLTHTDSVATAMVLLSADYID